jgi:hypothetical protein
MTQYKDRIYTLPKYTRLILDLEVQRRLLLTGKLQQTKPNIISSGIQNGVTKQARQNLVYVLRPCYHARNRTLQTKEQCRQVIPEMERKTD